MDSSAGESLWIDVTIHGHGELAIRFDQGMYAEYCFGMVGGIMDGKISLVDPNKTQQPTQVDGYLVGGGYQPLWKMMDESSVMMKFPTVSGKSFKIPWFQSPPTRYVLFLATHTTH